MAILELTTRVDLPAYSYVSTLDGTDYRLDYQFNDRMAEGAGKWTMSISDAQGNLLIGPQPLVADWPLFNRFKDPRLPLGTLSAFDTSGQTKDPGRFDLGDRVRMLYIEAGS